jgi:hypothetical protein
MAFGLNAGSASRRSRVWSGGFMLRKERSNSSRPEDSPTGRTPKRRSRSTMLQTGWLTVAQFPSRVGTSTPPERIRS